jgi:predicted phage gp36 major capsid-like protein
MSVFQRLAKAGNMSTGKAMAEWLRDTVEAAELMAATMERARAAPKVVTAELHAMMLGMADQTKELQDKFAKYRGSIDAGQTERKRSAPGGTAAVIPPPCNTGGKLPEANKRQNTKGPK